MQLGQRAELHGRRCCCTAASCSGQDMHAGVRVCRPRLVVALPPTAGHSSWLLEPAVAPSSSLLRNEEGQKDLGLK